jgi:hypothetical protein
MHAPSRLYAASIHTDKTSQQRNVMPQRPCHGLKQPPSLSFHDHDKACQPLLGLSAPSLLSTQPLVRVPALYQPLSQRPAPSHHPHKLLNTVMHAQSTCIHTYWQQWPTKGGRSWSQRHSGTLNSNVFVNIHWTNSSAPAVAISAILALHTIRCKPHLTILTRPTLCVNTPLAAPFLFGQ